MTAGEVRRWVIHLPIVAPDLLRAGILARTAARALAFLHVDAGETTVSPADDEMTRHRVFCGRRFDDGKRCVLRDGHETPCTTRPPR